MIQKSIMDIMSGRQVELFQRVIFSMMGLVFNSKSIKASQFGSTKRVRVVNFILKEAFVAACPLPYISIL